MRKTINFLLLLLPFFLFACADKEEFTGELSGHWIQVEALSDGVSVMTEEERQLTILFEANGIYRMYDPCCKKEHAGTWLVSDGDWLNMSMDKIIGRNSSDGSYRYGQVLVRFTILQLTDEVLELRIKTFLGERKKTIMFSQMEQDSSVLEPDEALALDTANKETHTYEYRFRRIK